MDDKTVASKEAYRKKLAALPILEKLRILDRMREREELVGRKLAVKRYSTESTELVESN
jgi:hypothetical protein